MTSYQKLKMENKILWEELEEWITVATKETMHSDLQKLTAEVELADIKWKIKRAQHEDKD